MTDLWRAGLETLIKKWRSEGFDASQFADELEAALRAVPATSDPKKDVCECGHYRSAHPLEGSGLPCLGWMPRGAGHHDDDCKCTGFRLHHTLEARAEGPSETPTLDLVGLMKAAQAEVRASVLWKRFIDGTPLENDIGVWMANFALAAVKSHGQYVAEFLNELYAIMVDPCAEGTISVSEMKAALLAAAIRDRNRDAFVAGAVPSPAPATETKK